MLTGQYNCSIDAKGRLIIPAKFRELLDNKQLYITKSTNGEIIDLYTEDVWETVIEKLNRIRQTDKKGSMIKRHIVGSSQDLKLDSQGRIMITPSLKEYAGLNKKIVVIGMDNKLEIWSAEKYEEYENSFNIVDIMDEVDIDF